MILSIPTMVVVCASCGSEFRMYIASVRGAARTCQRAGRPLVLFCPAIPCQRERAARKQERIQELHAAKRAGGSRA